MTIRVNLPGGGAANFPDGTPSSEIDAAIAQHLGSAAPTAPADTPAAPASPAAPSGADLYGGLGQLYDAFSSQPKAAAALQGAGSMLSLGLSNPVGGLIREGIHNSVYPAALYAALNPSEPGSFVDRMQAYKDAGKMAGPQTTREWMDAQRAGSEQTMAAEPGAAATGKGIGFAAGLVGGGGSSTAQAFTKVGLGRAALDAAKQAAPIGAVAGAAGSNSNLISGPDQPADPLGVAKDAALGATEAATLSAAAPVVTAGAAAAGRGAYNLATGLSTKSGPVMRQAVDQLVSHFRELGMSNADVTAYFQAHPQQALADLMPAQAAEVVAGGGSGAAGVKSFLENREALKTDRARAFLQDATGVTPNTAKPFEVALRDSNAALAAKAAPIYAAADQQPMAVTKTMDTLLNDPHVAPIWAKSGTDASTKNMLDMLAPDAPAPKYNAPLYDYSMSSTVPATQGPTPTLLSKLQTTMAALGDKGAELTQAGNRAEGAMYYQLKNSLRNEVLRQNPKFAEAQQLWSGEKSAQEAMDAGREAILNPSQGRTQLAREGLTSQAEKQAFAYGGMSGIEQILRGGNDLPSAASVRTDQIAKLWQNQEARDALKAVFGPENINTYQKALHVLGSENTMHETFRLSQATGRDTMRMSAIGRLGGLMGTVLGIATKSGTAGVPFAGRVLGDRIARALAGKQQALINVQKARILTSQDPMLITGGPLSTAPRGPLGLMPPQAGVVQPGLGLLSVGGTQLGADQQAGLLGQ